MPLVRVLVKQAQYQGIKRKGQVFNHPYPEKFPGTYEILGEKEVAALEGKTIDEPPKSQDNRSDHIQVTDAQKDSLIQNVVYNMSADDANNWTSQGLPKVDIVAEEIGMDITRQDIKQAVGDYNRSSKH